MRNIVKSFLTNDPFDGLPDGAVLLGGIVGGERPSKYSLSPDLWNRFFDLLGVKGRFAAFDLTRADAFPRFAAAVLGMPGFIDLTVTNPYKTSAFRCLGSLPFQVTAAERVGHLGCLNHLILDRGNSRILAENTDGRWLIRALQKRNSLDGLRVLLVGAGGAAASLGYELVREGAELFIVNIVEEDAHRLSGELLKFRKSGRTVSAGGFGMIGRIAPASDIIISAITESSPLTPEAIEKLPAACLLTDIRYGDKAEFAAAARKVGRFCIDGREMLYGQFHFAAEQAGAILGFSPETVAGSLGEIEEWFCR